MQKEGQKRCQESVKMPKKRGFRNIMTLYLLTRSGHEDDGETQKSIVSYGRIQPK